MATGLVMRPALDYREVFTIAIAMVVVLTTFPPAAEAQDSSTSLPRVGARLRVWMPNPVPRTTDTIPRIGRFHAVEAGDILLKRFGTVTPLRIPASQIVRVEQSVRGTPRFRGALRGALIGAAVPLVAGALSARGGSEEGALAMGWSLVVGAPIGAAAGAVIGFVVARGERWQPVSWPPREPR